MNTYYTFDIFIHHAILNLQILQKNQEALDDGLSDFSVSNLPLVFGFRLFSFPLMYLRQEARVACGITSSTRKKVQFNTGKSCEFASTKENLRVNLKSIPLFLFLFGFSDVDGREKPLLQGSATISLKSLDVPETNQQSMIISGTFPLKDGRSQDIGFVTLDVRLRFAAGDADSSSQAEIEYRPDYAIPKFNRTEKLISTKERSEIEEQYDVDQGSSSDHQQSNSPKTDTEFENMDDLSRILDVYEQQKKQTLELKKKISKIVSEMTNKLEETNRAVLEDHENLAPKKKRKPKVPKKKVSPPSSNTSSSTSPQSRPSSSIGLSFQPSNVGTINPPTRMTQTVPDFGYPRIPLKKNNNTTQPYVLGSEGASTKKRPSSSKGRSATPTISMKVADTVPTKPSYSPSSASGSPSSTSNPIRRIDLTAIGEQPWLINDVSGHLNKSPVKKGFVPPKKPQFFSPHIKDRFGNVNFFKEPPIGAAPSRYSQAAATTKTQKPKNTTTNSKERPKSAKTKTQQIDNNPKKNANVNIDVSASLPQGKTNQQQETTTTNQKLNQETEATANERKKQKMDMIIREVIMAKKDQLDKEISEKKKMEETASSFPVHVTEFEFDGNEDNSDKKNEKMNEALNELNNHEEGNENETQNFNSNEPDINNNHASLDNKLAASSSHFSMDFEDADELQKMVDEKNVQNPEANDNSQDNQQTNPDEDQNNNAEYRQENEHENNYNDENGNLENNNEFPDDKLDQNVEIGEEEANKPRGEEEGEEGDEK